MPPLPLTNRDIASVVWILAFATWGLSHRKVRHSLKGVVRAALHPKLLASVVALGVWSGGIIGLSHRLGLWKPELTKESMVWFAGVGLPLLFRVTDLRSDEHFLRRVALSALKLAVVISFFVNFFALPLIMELLLQPFLLVVIVMTVVTERSPAHASTKHLLEAILALVGFALAGYVFYRFSQEWGDLDLLDTGRRALLPVWLTVGALPMLFCFAVVAAYDQALVWVRVDKAAGWRKWRALLAMVMVLRFRLSLIASITPYWATRTARAGSQVEALRVMRDYRHGQ